MFENYDINSSFLLKKAELECIKLKSSYVGTEHLLLSILKYDKKMKSLLMKYKLSYSSLFSKIKELTKSNNNNYEKKFTPLLKQIILYAKELEKNKTEGIHYLISILEEKEGIAFKLLLFMNINIEKLQNELYKILDVSKKEVDNYSINLINEVNINEKVVLRDKYINQIYEILLRKNKNNPILVGEAGVGKTAIVEEIARRIKRGNVPSFLKNKIIHKVEMGSLISGTKYRGEFEEKLTNLLKSINEDDILFIDEIHTIVNAGGAEGAINASDILKPYLARGKIKCIGATTTNEYEEYIAKDKALSRRFEKITILEPNDEELKKILFNIKNEYEEYHDVIISKDNIENLINISKRFDKNKKNPDKTIELLDTLCAHIKLKSSNTNTNKLKKYIINNDFKNAIKYKKKLLNETNKKKITNEDIEEIIYLKNNIISYDNFEKNLKKLKVTLQSNLYGQKDQIEELILLMKDYSYKSDSNPLIINITGDKGTGKTYLLDLIFNYFKEVCFVSKIDLKSINLENLVGSNYCNNYILKGLTQSGFKIILFDNYKQALSNVQNFIENMFENSEFKDYKYNNYNLSNTIFLIVDFSTNNNIGFLEKSNDNFVINNIKLKSIEENDIVRYLSDKKINHNKEYLKIANYEKFGFIKLKYLLKKEKILD